MLPPYQVRGDGGKGGSGQTLTIDLKTTTPGGAGETALWVMVLAALNKDPGLYGKFQASPFLQHHRSVTTRCLLTCVTILALQNPATGKMELFGVFVKKTMLDLTVKGK